MLGMKQRETERLCHHSADKHVYHQMHIALPENDQSSVYQDTDSIQKVVGRRITTGSIQDWHAMANVPLVKSSKREIDGRISDPLQHFLQHHGPQVIELPFGKIDGIVPLKVQFVVKLAKMLVVPTMTFAPSNGGHEQNRQKPMQPFVDFGRGSKGSVTTIVKDHEQAHMHEGSDEPKFEAVQL